MLGKGQIWCVAVFLLGAGRHGPGHDEVVWFADGTISRSVVERPSARVLDLYHPDGTRKRAPGAGVN